MVSDKLVRNDICPGINKLVDVLYTEEMNTYVNDICKTDLDKKTFFMFIIMYFSAYFSVSGKDNIKLVLSDIMRNPDKRFLCVQLFTKFQNSLQQPNLLQLENDVNTLLLEN